MEDCQFLNLEEFGQLKTLSKFAIDEDIMIADSATLKSDNQKNGRKGVCVHQHANWENSCAESIPLGLTTVTSVRILVEIGKYGYQHIGTTQKIAVTSLMRTSDEI